MFQMAMDDDILVKNSFGFQFAGVLVNDAITREAILEDRNAPKVEKSIEGYSRFLFYDDNWMPLVEMDWQHRFNHMVGRYNDIYRVQMQNITLMYADTRIVRIWQNRE